ncbi:TonB-dependent receptor [Geobacter hydrogenophilus]|uniref:TonB-dependent receptor n=1 Tax=Geobacter hydrogenophilus TaxID=40983 RepID=A0A9W6LDG3_9BACT|nr:TonB-dependent receptor [Geobacter hydrogenophilus]MBT0893215.1 TonB-dependent receptor [Geobacter hydrogenophilus]GLI38940.1 TonB-dependent receptor [Geobacter hydrogenophilus]
MLLLSKWAPALMICTIPLIGLIEPSWGSEDENLNLSELGLEDLMNIQVTSVSKKQQKLSDAGAAIFVVTREDIRRSGATSIPEVLRMVPGIQVARLDANKWAVSARGFNDRFSDKLLVLMDGRTVFTPLFSGVYWDVQDAMLEDIDRIEVIRGPGAALWGANAFNGVINIITKHAQETQGGLLSAGAGTEERGFGGARYGGRVGDDTYYRLYTKYFNRDGGVDAAGNEGKDDWSVLRGGFRVDSDLTAQDSLTVQGDIYHGKEGETFTVPLVAPPYSRTFNSDTDIAGGNLLSRWTRKLSDTADMALQLYYDRTERDMAILGEIRDTIDVDFQNRFRWGSRQEIMWGLGYRFSHESITNKIPISFTPDKRSDNLYSLFVRDDIALIEEKLRLVLSSRFEHNDFTGFEIQPNARLIWTPDYRQTVWAAVSRAVRTPSSAEENFRNDISVYPPGTVNQTLPVLFSGFGSRDFKSEDVIAYELGYRVAPAEHFSVDIATFYDNFSRLRTLEFGTPYLEVSPSPHLVLPGITSNKMHGESYGVEVAADWLALEWWRLHAAYSFLEMQMRLDPDSNSLFYLGFTQGTSPRHQGSLRSSMELGRSVELDVWVRYVDRLPEFDIDRYVTLDARLAWKPTRNLELSLVGRNLTDSHHPEFNSAIISTAPTEVERSYYGKITWRY